MLNKVPLGLCFFKTSSRWYKYPLDTHPRSLLNDSIKPGCPGMRSNNVPVRVVLVDCLAHVLLKVCEFCKDNKSARVNKHTAGHCGPGKGVWVGGFLPGRMRLARTLRLRPGGQKRGPAEERDSPTSMSVMPPLSVSCGALRLLMVPGTHTGGPTGGQWRPLTGRGAVTSLTRRAPGRGLAGAGARARDSLDRGGSRRAIAP